MAAVTAIEKRGGKARVVFSDGQECRLPAGMLEHFSLYRGAEADPAGLIARLETDAVPYALAEILRLQARRDHTGLEIRKALHDKAYPDGAVTLALSQLQKAGVVDEKRYGEGLVHRKSRQKGRNALRMEMLTKGMNAEDAEAALEELDEEEEYAAALLRARKMAQRQTERDKIFASLLRRGYNRTLIIRVLKDIDEADE